MQTETKLVSDLKTADKNAAYDASVKRLLANREILAWIMKDCVEEYKNCTVKDITEKYIEKDPEISATAVNPDETNRAEKESVTGMNTEDKSVNEGTVYYDIRFFASAPGSSQIIKLIINIEAQNDYYPGYPLVKRGIYYCGRMLSAQYGTEFVGGHYENLKKVYSIWICSHPPKENQNAITKYAIGETSLMGSASEKRENYDMLSVIMVNLSENFDTSSGKMIDLLGVMLLSKEEPQERANIMHRDYGITITRELEGEVSLMCNLSQGLIKEGEARGISIGKAKGKILGTVETYHDIGLNDNEIITKIMDKFSITREEAEKYLVEVLSANEI